MKKQAYAFIVAALGLLVAPAAVSAATIFIPDVSITETPAPGGGVYTVTNNTADSYLTAFGVSNSDSIAIIQGGFDGIDSLFPTFGCQSTWCYSATNIDASNWGTTIAYGGLTFQQAFGDFADNVDPGDNTINWYTAVDGALGPGDTSSDFFGFLDAPLSSMALGILEGPGGTVTTFQNQDVSAVPLPAAAWLFGGAFAGLFGVARRRAA